MAVSTGHRGWRVLIAIAGILSARGAEGQDAPVPPIGSRVRIMRSSGSPVIGAVVAADRGSFRITVADGRLSGPTAVDSAEVRRVQLSLGRHSRAGDGAAIGAGFGAALGLAFYTGVNSDPELSRYGSADSPATVVLLTAATGGAIGALLGSLSHHERWRDLDVRPARRLSVQVQPAKRRIGLSLAIGRAPG